MILHAAAIDCAQQQTEQTLLQAQDPAGTQQPSLHPGGTSAQQGEFAAAGHPAQATAQGSGVSGV